MDRRPWSEIINSRPTENVQERRVLQNYTELQRPRTFLPEISYRRGTGGSINTHISYKSLERDLLVDVKNRRLKPRSRLTHDLHESPRQRLGDAFKDKVKHLQGQANDPVQHNLGTGRGLQRDDTFIVNPKEIKHVVAAGSEQDDYEKPVSPFTITDSYDMKARPRGYALVINNYDFYKEMIALTENGPQMLKINQKGLRRDGSIVDTDKLVALFRDDLQFIVRDFYNLTASEMIKVLDECRKLDHSNYDCFICCIGSHGRKGSLFGSDCREIRITDITAMYSGLKCVTLSGKPKCFFIQSCGGNHNLKGVMSGSVMPHGTRPEVNYFIPQLDFIFGYSLLKDCTSFKGGHDESIFLQTIVKYIQRYRQKSDLINILTKVKHFLKKKRRRENDAHDLFQCNFRALLYFKD